MPSSVLDGSLEIRIHGRNDRALNQFTKEPPQPNPAHGDRCDDIKPVNMECTRLQNTRKDPVTRPDHIKHIDEPHDQNKYREHRDPACMALEILLEQNEKRKCKVKKDQGHSDVAPPALHSGK